jgi:GDP/UDP-N,N'-diacetylbacillosamine 2-epimerase (hydrolysing)
MKTICIITHSLNEYQILKPLIKQFQKDKDLYLTIVLMDKHQSSEMEINYTRIEEEGFTVYEKTDIVFNGQNKTRSDNLFDREQSYYNIIFKLLNPDIIILSGNSYQTFVCAIAASQKNIPIAHIQGGKSNSGIFEDSYCCGISKLGHLHFTSTRKHHRQIIQSGKHPDRVFNVGSLMVEKVKTLPLEKKNQFYEKIDFNKNSIFLFISFHPDSSTGSKNVHIFQEILDSLSHEKLKNFKLLFNKPKTDGLGKMIIQMIDNFITQNWGKASSLSNMNLSDLSNAIKYCSAVVGNDLNSITIAPGFRTPVINITSKLQNRIKTKNIIDCHPSRQDIFCAIQNGLSVDFKSPAKEISSPFDKISTARKIKESIKKFTRS